MDRDSLLHDYFEWLCEQVYDSQYSDNPYFRKVLMFLHNKPFTYIIDMDQNREEDGNDLRYQFGHERGISKIDDYHCPMDIYHHLNSRCSVLEMMVALAIRCENHVMYNPDLGDRTSHWFWKMIASLGFIGNFRKFDRSFAEDIVSKFLNRTYERNGSGGLFTVLKPKQDMRDLEIWYQMHTYLGTIL